jgi:hypothetical protein
VINIQRHCSRFTESAKNSRTHIKTSKERAKGFLCSIVSSKNPHLTPVESSKSSESYLPMIFFRRDKVSIRRCALQPFWLLDGTTLKVGECTCSPSGAINTSAKYYASPTDFSGFQFVDSALAPDTDSSTKARQPQPSKLTDVSRSYLIWETGRMAW